MILWVFFDFQATFEPKNSKKLDQAEKTQARQRDDIYFMKFTAQYMKYSCGILQGHIKSIVFRFYAVLWGKVLNT